MAGDDDERKTLVARRAYYKGAITKQRTKLAQENLATLSVQKLNIRQEKLQHIYNEYVNLCISLEEDEDPITENAYLECSETLRIAIEGKSQKEGASKVVSKVKLPHVNLPVFDGNYTEFKPFFEMFTSMIDRDEGIEDIQKLFYLRSYLRGEALDLITSLPVIGSSYKESLKILNERYDNKTRIVFEHISSLLDMTVISKPSVQSLRALINEAKQHVAYLKNLGQAVDQWDSILVCILSRKLDQLNRRAFYLERDSTSMPTFNEFVKFLEGRALALEASVQSDSKEATKKPVQSASHAKASNVAVNVACHFCEFASQLPHGGGAFYSAETAEASRAHYVEAWPSLLYAACLRFNDNIHAASTKTSENAEDNILTKGENRNCEFFESVDERFHLLLGICIEALCVQRDMSLENTLFVLLSLVTLLNSRENRARLLKDSKLAIELCQIIHRAGLTQESIKALLLTADVLKSVIMGASEQLCVKMQHKIKELAPIGTADSAAPHSILEVVHLLGDGGPTGDLPPGKSLVFTCLEVCLCLLVRQLPSLNPLKEERKIGVIGTPKGLGVHGDALLVKSLAALSKLLSLTSPQGALSLLPTILFLGTEILKECKGEPVIAEAGILLLQSAAECKVARVQEHTCGQHDRLLQSALASLVERIDGDEIEQRIEPVVAARGMTVVLSRAGLTTPLHYPCINHFRKCLETGDNEIFASCCSVLRSVWSPSASPECVSLWARALAGRVIGRVATKRHPDDLAHTKAAIAAFTALDQLVQTAPETARIQMLYLLVPIVISYLCESSEFSCALANYKAIHQFALQWLTNFGPKHPLEFKKIMTQSSELRNKLESVLKAPLALHRLSTPTNRRRPEIDARPVRPSIRLKIDFSNFR